MSRAKRQKEKDDANREAGSVGMAIVAAILSVILGLFLGVLNLAMVPVSEVKEMPPDEELKPHTVYFVQGQERGGNSYRAKEAALLQAQPGTIILNEEELNSWSRNTFKFGAPAKPGEETQSGYVQIKPAAPRFRIRDGVFNMAMTMEVNAFGMNQKVLVQSDGHFAKEGGVWKFVPEVTYIGSAPIPEQGAAPVLVGRMMGIFENAEDFGPYYNSWADLETVEVDENELVLIRK